MVYIAILVRYVRDGEEYLDWRKEMSIDDLIHLENIAEQFVAEVSNVRMAKEMDSVKGLPEKTLLETMMHRNPILYKNDPDKERYVDEQEFMDGF